MKRLRHKKNKSRAKWTEQDAKKIRERAEAYEQAEDGSTVCDTKDSMNLILNCNQINHEQADAINEAYSALQSECKMEGMHLLPQIPPVHHSTKRICESDDIKLEVKVCRMERDRALKETLQYRTLVERLETEVSEMKANMHRRVSVGRDFWRSKMYEGRSRSGAMVKEAMSQ